MKTIEITVPDELYRNINTERIKGCSTITKKIEHLLQRGYDFTCGEQAEMIERIEKAQEILFGPTPEEEIEDDTDEPVDIISSQDYDYPENTGWY